MLDCIDFFIIKSSLNNYMDIENVNRLSADTTLTVLTCSNTILDKKKKAKLTTKFTNWKKYRDETNEKMNFSIRLKIVKELEIPVDHFRAILIEVAGLATPDNPIKIQYQYRIYAKSLTWFKKQKKTTHCQLGIRMYHRKNSRLITLLKK